MSHSHCTCNLKSSYFTTFSNSFVLMLWSSGSLGVDDRNIKPSMFYFSICIVKFHGILHFSFSSTGSGWWEYHFSLHSVSNFLRRTLLYRTLSFPANWEQKQTICVILWTFSLYGFHKEDTFILSMAYFTEFVLRACSFAAQIRLSF